MNDFIMVIYLYIKKKFNFNYLIINFNILLKNKFLVS